MIKHSLKTISLLSVLVMLLAMAPVVGVGATDRLEGGAGIEAEPTLNGLYYGDGDVNNYTLLGENLNPDGTPRAKLYYWDSSTSENIYLAVVVDPSVNDNVFGTKALDGAYLSSANWSAVHTAERLISSDNVEIGFTCNGQSWNWFHGYAYWDEFSGEWKSDPADGSIGGGTYPAGTEFASSLTWNLNAAAWDVTLAGDPGATLRTSPNDWKSPYADPNDVTVGVDYPTAYYDGATGDLTWEWPMVYEARIPKTECLDVNGDMQAWSIFIWSAHNSPAKDGEQDVPIEVWEYGDAPDDATVDPSLNYTYPTVWGGASGLEPARHKLIPGGPRLGTAVDPETDGQQDGLALGDDGDLYPFYDDYTDDEDGVDLRGVELRPGNSYCITVTVTLTPSMPSAYVDGWIDFHRDGIWDAGDRIEDRLLPVGVHNDVCFTVPEDATVAPTYVRFRINSAGNLPPDGPASDGEVEDYRIDVRPLAVDLTSFTAKSRLNAIVVRWETASEIDNLGFNLYRSQRLEGPWNQINDRLIPSQVPPGSPAGAIYKFRDTEVEPGVVYYYLLEDVDTRGLTTSHGPVSAQFNPRLPQQPTTGFSLTGESK